MSTITLTNLKTTFGAYFQDGGQGMKDILKALMVPASFDAKWAPLIPTTDTVARMVKADIGNVLQAYQVALTPQSGDVSFEPLQRNLSHLKIEKEFAPAEIEDSYVGFMAADTNKYENYPLTKFVVEQLMVAKSRENWNNSVVFHGNAVSPTAGTAGSVAGAHDGLKTQIADDISANKITPINSGASFPTDAADAVVYLHDWIKAVKATSALHSYTVTNHCDYIYVDQAFLDLYREGLPQVYGYNYTSTGEGLQSASSMVKIPLTNLTLVGDVAMAGSQRFMMTPKFNRYNRIKKPQSETNFNIDISGRTLTPFADFWRQLSYWDPAYMYVNQLT
jgi:hypothetical protein